MNQCIVIMGSPGSGKSTLAMKVAQKTGLPLYHMDALFWEGNKNISEEVLIERLQSVVDREAWIIDGNYKNTLEMRVAKADVVIWLKAPRWKCIMRVIYRYFKDKLQKGPGNNPNILEFKFLKYIWNFPQNSFPEMERIYEKYQNECRWIVV
ncbi:AAA family ATPase [Staphylococcus ratti]|uniref:Topology modulation protein n=1 Tax=Staphylococcus ratti TaxID=2892440 RepID=A0ABY3PD76_9STAP|nr:AAA family ATPase [Staphylococcus ratti]UEX90248.1 topology modulation protein [Staphylococcus ratti]